MKKLSKLKASLTCLLLAMLVAAMFIPAVDAYVYNGYKWTSGSASWRFSTTFPSGYQQSVQNAASTWNNAGSSFSFNYIWYELYNKFDWADLGSGSTLGSTTVWYSGSSISQAVTTLNSQKSWTTSPGSSYPPYDVETVSLHEFGHWLSLGHSSSTSAVMYAYYTGTKRSLTQDDINGIRYIYP